MAKKAQLPHATRNDLAATSRAQVVAILNARLADTIDLMLQAKQAHWNVKGPDFFQLHDLFDRVYAAAALAMDELAERAVQLGGVALGTVQAVQVTSTVRPYPTALAAGSDHVKAVADSLATVAKATREAIDDCDAAGDADTADLFTGISRELDKQLWFVEAHLQAPR